MNDSNESNVGVIIPCYRVSDQLGGVLSAIPDCVNHIIIVDDCCPEGSREVAEEYRLRDKRIHVVCHDLNLGVGGAVVSGYEYALRLGCRILVKLDGDGQMDPEQIPSLIEPIIAGRADYTKGNRFRDFTALKQMPKIRLFGNSFLSFFLKAASGYWNIVDPTNGFTAVRADSLKKIEMDKLAQDYFFESDMLLKLSLIEAVVEDVPMPAKYGAEKSSMKINRVIGSFPGRLLRGLLRRIFLQYFVYDFNMASVYILIGLPLALFGLILGAGQWLDSILTGKPKAGGIIMLSALPIILGLEMLLQAVNIDINRVPGKRK